MKYKVGDIVQYIKENPPEFTGSMGVVREVCDYDKYKIDWVFRMSTRWKYYNPDSSCESVNALKLVATSSANETTP